MRTLCVILVFQLATICGQQSAKAQVDLTENMSSLRFEENKGQIIDQSGIANNDVLYILKGEGITLHFRKDGILYRWHYIERFNPEAQGISEATGLLSVEGNPQGSNGIGSVKIHSTEVLMKWNGVNESGEVVAEQQNDDFSNYYLKHCPNGITNVRNFQRLVYKNLYPNIDAVYYIKDGKLKYDLVLHQGSDLNDIRFSYSGHNAMDVKNDQIKVYSPLGELIEDEPIAIGTNAKLFFKQTKDGAISFHAEYRGSEGQGEFVIDPLITWLTYYGGAGNETGQSTAVSSAGDVFFAGYTTSTSGVASGGFDNSYGGGAYDAFLVKFNLDGARQWATYYGGSGNDLGRSVEVDVSGNVYLTGETSSTSGMASGGYDNTYGGGTYDAFLVKFNGAGARQWATYYGGTGEDIGKGMTLDTSGNIFLAGQTTSSTSIASGGFQNTLGGGYDAFLTKFNSTGALQWGTYYGGLGSDYGLSTKVDPSGNIYLTGYTNSSSGIALGGHQNTFGGVYDAFLVKFNNSGARQWASYYGGANEDYGYSVAVDASGNAYITGYTSSSSGIALGGYQTALGGSYDALLVKFNSSGVRQWGTYYGGSSDDRGFSATVDAFGDVYFAGFYTEGAQSASKQAIWVRFKPDGASAYRESGFGSTSADNSCYSIVADMVRNIYVAGSTNSSTFAAHDSSNVPYSSSGFQNSNGGVQDGFLIKFNVPHWAVPGALEYACVDPLGNVYHTSASYSDFYVSKYNSVGGSQWTITYGGTGSDLGKSIAVDGQGNVYVAGYTNSTTGIASGGHDNTFGGGTFDAFLIKFNSAGVRQWATYYGGSGEDKCFSVCVDGYGNVYLAGITSSTSSIASGGHQNSYGGGSYDAFLVKFNPAGVRQWATYYGGTGNSDYGEAVATDMSGNVFLAGLTSSTTGIASGGHQNTYGGGGDGFLVKFNVSGVRQWATYYGGASDDIGTAVIVDGAGNVYMGGNTSSTTGISSGGFQNSFGGGSYDDFLVKFNNSGVRQWATYFGGSGWEEAGNLMAVDAAGNIYIAGSTTSATNIASKGFQNSLADQAVGNFDAFMVKFDGLGNRIAATYIGHYGFSGEFGRQVAVDGAANISLSVDQTGFFKLGNFQSLPFVEPIAQPTSFVASNITINSFKISFSAASGSPQGYLAIRKAGSAPSGTPVDGASYAIGQSLGDGVVAYSNNGLTFNESGLASGTQYFYKIFSFNGNGETTNYLVTSPLSGNATTLSMAPEPTAQPTNFNTFNVTTSSFSVSFSSATGSPSGYLAIRKEWSSPTGTPVDGVTYSIGQSLGDGTVVHSSSGTTFLNSGLAGNTTYYFKIFSYNGSGSTSNYLTSFPLTGSETTADPCPGCRLQDQQFQVFALWENNNAVVSWENPTDKGNYYFLERSTEGVNFETVDHQLSDGHNSQVTAIDLKAKLLTEPILYYRFRYLTKQKVSYSAVATLENQLQLNNVKISPNPASDIITIFISEGFVPSVVELTDILGKTVWSKRLPQNEIKIDVRELPNGNYFIRLNFEDSQPKVIRVLVAH